MSQLVGSVVLITRILRDGLNQGIIKGNPMPYKDDQGRGRTTHHALRHQFHHIFPIRAEGSNPSTQAIRHLRTLRHKVLVRKTHKIGSPGADVLDHCNNICHSINNTLENPRPRRSSLHRLYTYSGCTKQRKRHHGNTVEKTMVEHQTYTRASPPRREDVCPRLPPP